MIITDIETASDNLEPAYEAWKLSTMTTSRTDASKVKSQYPLSPLTGKITMIGLLSNIQLDKEWKELGWKESEWLNHYYMQLGLLPELSEKELLTMFWDIMQKLMIRENALPIVTFNGKEFDIPYIALRSIFNGIKFPNCAKGLFDKWVSKYNNSIHVDLRGILLNNDRYARGTLYEFAYRFGINDTMDYTTGAECIDWYNEKKYEKIYDKNLQDLVKSLRMYLAIEHII